MFAFTDIEKRIASFEAALAEIKELQLEMFEQLSNIKEMIEKQKHEE